MQPKFWEDEHKRTLDRLAEYFDGSISPVDNGLVTRHLAACRDCRAARETLSVAREILRAVPEVQPPRSFAISRPVPITKAPSYFRGMVFATAASFVLLIMVSAGEQALSYPGAGASLAGKSAPLAFPGGGLGDSRTAESEAGVPILTSGGASQVPAAAPLAPASASGRNVAPPMPVPEAPKVVEYSKGVIREYPVSLLGLSKLVLAALTCLLAGVTAYNWLRTRSRRVS